MSRYKYSGFKPGSADGRAKKEPFYTLFNHIRARCRYPKNKDYERYGGRGITFEWDNYIDFKKDMYESYLKHKKNNKTTSLERIDNDGPYSKENCRWATLQEQHQNKRTSRYLTYKGRTMIIADWAREIGTSRQTIRHRCEAGWTPEQIIETPVNYANRL